jgi:general secretion pathway protein J
MRARGFSLLEVLAALALLAILLLGVYSGVRSTTLSVSRGSANVARLDEIRAAREFLRRELASATALPWKLDGQGKPVAFEGDGKTFRFVSVLPGYLGKLGPQVIALKPVIDPVGGDNLAVTLAPLPLTHAPMLAATEETLLAHVRSVRFRYLRRGATAWQDRWTDTAALPAAVEIVVVPAEGDGAWPPLVVAPRQDPHAVNTLGASRSLAWSPQ